MEYPLGWRALIGIGILLACAGAGLFMREHMPLPDVVVTRMADGFVPAKITIRKGQAVVFRATGDAPFWPASDFHPTHTLYPEFDPKRALQPSESWRFVFSKAGVWTYHDHLAETVRGTVIVLGAPGESAEECLSHVSTSSDGSSNCWAADMTETLQAKGLPAAFDMFAALYAESPAFRGLSCHDAGHILGAAAYKEYSDNHTIIDRPETSYCGYGFYHGFMEAMLADQGPSHYKEVRDYCDALKTNGNLNNPSGACYHGIGHAAFDSLPGDLWGSDQKMVQAALTVCDQAVIGSPERAQCSTGVFNALAVAESAHSYKLAFATHDPLEICRVQKYEYQEGCYQELGIGVIREENLDRAASLSLIESIGNTDARAATLLGYIADEVKRSIASIDLASYHSACAAFSSTNARACEHGVLSGLREAGEPGREYEKMFQYCALDPAGADRSECYSFTISQTKDIASDKAAFRSACLAIPDKSAQGSCE